MAVNNPGQAPAVDANNAQMVALAQKLLGEDIKQPGVAQNLTPSQIHLLQSELTAQQSRSFDNKNLWTSADAIQGLNDAQMVQSLGEQSWTEALAAADTFAANTSWRVYPTVNQLNNMIEDGKVDLGDSKAVQKYLFSQMPPDMQQRMPWAANGMSQSNYTDTLNSLRAQWKTVTGDAAGFDQFTTAQLQAMANDPSSAQTSWFEDPTITAKYQWMKQGKTYDYLVQNYQNNPAQRQQVIARFGAGGVDDINNYLQQLDNPLQPPASGTGGGHITEGSNRTTSNQAGRTPVG